MATDPVFTIASDPLESLIQKLRARDVMSDEEEAALRSAAAEGKEMSQGRVITRSGESLDTSILLVDGYACRYQDLKDGQRQIMEIHVPGDFVDLHSLLLRRLEHNVGSLTPVRLLAFPHDRLRRISERYPHLTRLLWCSTLLDSAIHRERILSIGRRSALTRIGHLLCELYRRLEIVGLTDGFSYRLPITQSDLADACGLTAVHVNRMLRQLRDQGLLTFRNDEVTIHDWELLQRASEFNDSYLFLERRPR